jgi:hypothetical protein
MERMMVWDDREATVARVLFTAGLISLALGAVLSVALAFAGGITTASAFLQTFALEAQSYLYGGAAILFLGALIAAGASGFMHITNLLGVPIYYAILASIGAGVIAVFLGGVGLTAGAELGDVVSTLSQLP